MKFARERRGFGRIPHGVVLSNTPQALKGRRIYGGDLAGDHRCMPPKCYIYTAGTPPGTKFSNICSSWACELRLLARRSRRGRWRGSTGDDCRVLMCSPGTWRGPRCKLVPCWTSHLTRHGWGGWAGDQLSARTPLAGDLSGTKMWARAWLSTLKTRCGWRAWDHGDG